MYISRFTNDFSMNPQNSFFSHTRASADELNLPPPRSNCRPLSEQNLDCWPVRKPRRKGAHVKKKKLKKKNTYPRVVVRRQYGDRVLVSLHRVQVSAPVGVQFAQRDQRRHPAGLMVHGILGKRAVQGCACFQHGFRFLAPAHRGQQLSHVQVRHCEGKTKKIK